MKAVIVSDSHGRFGGIQDIIEKEAPFDLFLHAGDIQEAAAVSKSGPDVRFMW